MLFNKNNIINKIFIKIMKNRIKKKNILITMMKINRKNYLRYKICKYKNILSQLQCIIQIKIEIL